MSGGVLGYWDIRGLGEPIRYLLHYKGVDFEDKRYYTHPSWMAEKFKIGLDFPNLPYFIDEDVKISQSKAILRYLAQKYDLDGQTKEQKVKVMVVEQQLNDLCMNFLQTCYNPEFEKLKPNYVKNLPAQLKLLSDFLGEKQFLVGDNVTYVDFMAYDVFDFHRLFMPSIFNEFSNLLAYQERMENLPELQKYFHSHTYRRWPFFAPFAKFGGSGEMPKYE
ncbi:hypothetical protein JTE90_010070 [Oedothorax gibbosus]|uniref:glutathione transferase n=1 Tax=Oedothorax gibbosus TaxID=931172 RepID=A0AAV6UX58_9ARAC|nr:hypothetical protein JTE90_010070 [Oedothorax gibbosus]